MPRKSKVSSRSFEPLKKNSLSLRDDEPLGSDLKIFKIGGENTPLSLSEDEFRITADFFLDGKLTNPTLKTDNQYLELSSDEYIRFARQGSTGTFDIYPLVGTSYFFNNGGTYHFITETAGSFLIGSLATDLNIFRFDIGNSKLTISSPLDTED